MSSAEWTMLVWSRRHSQAWPDRLKSSTVSRHASFMLASSSVLSIGISSDSTTCHADCACGHQWLLHHSHHQWQAQHLPQLPGRHRLQQRGLCCPHAANAHGHSSHHAAGVELCQGERQWRTCWAVLQQLVAVPCCMGKLMRPCTWGLWLYSLRGAHDLLVHAWWQSSGSNLLAASPPLTACR